jgi:hypothetical protein
VSGAAGPVLRSQPWFGGDGLRALRHGTRMRQFGAAPADYQGRPASYWPAGPMLRGHCRGDVTQADQGCDSGFLARPGRHPEPDPR